MKAKKVILIIAAMATVLMFVFPPTVYFIPETADKAASFRFEYMFVLSIPDDVHINGILLLSEWFGLLLFTGILMSFFPSSDPTRIDKPRDAPPEQAASEKDEAGPDTNTRKE